MTNAFLDVYGIADIGEKSSTESIVSNNSMLVAPPLHHRCTSKLKMREGQQTPFTNPNFVFEVFFKSVHPVFYEATLKN